MQLKIRLKKSEKRKDELSNIKTLKHQKVL